MIDILRRFFPTTICTWLFPEVAGHIVRELGLPWPDGLPARETRTEGDAETMDRLERVLEHGGIRVTLTQAMDHDHPAMESADRSAWGEIQGLPGGVSMHLRATGNGSWMKEVELRGEAGALRRVLEATAAALTRLVRARSALNDEVAVPSSWAERARAASPGNCVLGDAVLPMRSWSLEPFEDGWFAVETAGTLDERSSCITLSPIGPLPRALEDSYFVLSRAAGGEPPRPSVDALGAALLGERVPRAPEEKRAGGWTRSRRFRVGPWVLLDRWPRLATGGASAFHFRLQHDRGGPWAVVAEGEVRKNGLGQAYVQILGDAAARDAVEARLRTWTDAQGWTVKRVR